jgi:eukaryotic-like serine/threonine-protein kinase
MAQDAATLKRVFDSALEISSAADRKAYLDKVCAAAPEIRKKVEALLKAHEDAGSFLEKPAAQAPATASYHSGGKQPDQPYSGTVEYDNRPPASDEPSFHQKSGQRIGPYKLVKKIGEGGMGAVYLAEQEQPVKRQVALKIIKPGMDSAQVVARFEAERQALTMMDHLSIAKVFDAGATKNGLPYFVMELVHGVPMSRYCDDNKLTIRQRLELFVPICQAIQHAHRKGIIHRDIKPSNVLVTIYEGKPIPKVIDFGLAKAMGQQLADRSPTTQMGTILGTFEYMSPEQADFTVQDVDTRSDVYSLGVMFYELLTGTTPLDRSQMRQEGLEKVLRRIKHEDAPRPSARLSGLGQRLAKIAEGRQAEPAKLAKLYRGELDWIALKALEKDRNRRYESALEFGQDVQSYLNDEPVKACPPSARYRLGKWARKHRALLAGVAGVVTFILATLGVLMVSNYRVNEALKAEIKANNEKDRALQDALKANGRMGESLNLLDNITGSLLIKQINLGEADKLALRKVLKTYERFAAELGDTREARELAAGGQFRIASTRAFLGDLEMAEAGFRRAIQLNGELAVLFPDKPDFRHALSRCHIGLGKVFRNLGNWGGAKTAYREASRLAAKLVEDEPANMLYVNAFAECRNDLGLLACDLNDWANAREPLEQAIVSWEKMTNEAPAELAPRFNWAVSCNNLILVYRGLNLRTETEKAYQKVDELLKNLEIASPTSPEFRFLRIKSTNNLGLIYLDSQQGAEAAKAYRRAVDLGKSLTADYGAVPEYRFELARSYFNLGFPNQQSERQAAEEAYRQSISMALKLVSISKDPRYRLELANGYINLGDILSNQNKLDQAREVFEKAIGILEKLKLSFPDVAEYRINLAGTTSNLANTIRDQDSPKEAIPWYDKAIDSLLPLAAQKPPPHNARLFLRNSSWDRANALGQLLKHEEAVKDWQRAIDLDSGADKIALGRFLQTSQMELVLKKEAGSPNSAPGLFFKAAKVYALAAGSAAENDRDARLQKQYSARALVLLRKAKSAGFFNDSPQVEQLKKEPAFTSLRQSPDFKKFVDELSGKEK